MNIQQLIERQALKDLVDTFSNLADEKRVTEQMPLFTEDAQVTTYIGGQLFADMTGRTEIEQVFNQFSYGLSFKRSAYGDVYRRNHSRCLFDFTLSDEQLAKITALEPRIKPVFQSS